MEKPSWALIITSVISSNFQVVNTTDTVVACVVDNQGATRFNEISSTIVKCLISEKVSRIFDNHRNRAYICSQHFVEWWLSAEMGLIYFVPHQEDDIDTLSVILAICEGNAPVIGGFPRNSNAEFRCFVWCWPEQNVGQNSHCRWFETSWRLCDVIVIICMWDQHPRHIRLIAQYRGGFLFISNSNPHLCIILPISIL